MEALLFLILLFPLAGGTLNAVAGMRLPRAISNGLAVSGVIASAVLTVWLWPLAEGDGTRVTLVSWLAAEDLHITFGILFDRLAAPMTLMVTMVSSLIHLYAVGYMKDDPDYARFFALMNFFVFAMLTIVLADNLLFLFLGWEGVGFCSYALIGFWYRERRNADAGRKAFLVTRVGDVFLMVAIVWLCSLVGTVSIPEINSRASGFDPMIVTVLALLLLGGAVGKSAQLPLSTWLPDAMAGPTPVSALIHAATMVTAGVYLLCRMFPLVSLSPTALAVISVVGAGTALYAASCALAQREIKRVLAYSTMSQVGFMFLGVGAGTVVGAMFHLLTHAFFKAVLFMGAGVIIHLMGNENDIFKMGGLRSKNPLLFWSFLAGAVCLAGVPLTSGFFSKDAILVADLALGTPLALVVDAAALAAALLTAIYTFRLVILVFAGSERTPVSHHSVSRVMLWTLPPLAILALFGGAIDLPHLWGGSEVLAHWLDGAAEAAEIPTTLEVEMAIVTFGLVLVGWLLAWRRYRPWHPPSTSIMSSFLLSGWRADRLVELAVLSPFRALTTFFSDGLDGVVIDGGLDRLARACRSGGELLRRMTTGRLSNYLAAMALGLLAILALFAARIWLAS
jgi:NADH-quinone oxidoreductase subunit L